MAVDPQSPENRDPDGPEYLDDGSAGAPPATDAAESGTPSHDVLRKPSAGHEGPAWSSPSPAGGSVHSQPTLTSWPGNAETVAPGPQQNPAAAGTGQGPSGAFGAPTGFGNPYPPVGNDPYAPPMEMASTGHGHYPAAPYAPNQMAWGTGQNNGMGVAALVLGILSLVGFCFGPLAMILGILAVVFGGMGRARAGRGEASNGGQALAGLICGAVSLPISLFIFVLMLTS